MTTRDHPADRQQCPGCGGEDLTADEQERGRCDRCAKVEPHPRNTCGFQMFGTYIEKVGGRWMSICHLPRSIHPIKNSVPEWTHDYVDPFTREAENDG